MNDASGRFEPVSPVTPAPADVCPECQATTSGPYCVNCGCTMSGIAPESWDDTRGTESRPAGALVGAYQLTELLGSGGMGHVYRAEHQKLGRKVAVKMLRREYASNRVAVSRFFAEARAVNRISHENIVEITDFIENPGGDNAIIMELLRGEDLGARIERERVLPVATVLAIGAQIASALGAVHAAGMVHRDLKPDNVFLIERAGMPHFVKILDFGVAKLSDPISERQALHSTAAGQIIGTPQYMSPEQASGAPVDHRTDIYALGIVLYEMLTGQLPFTGANFGELLVKHLTVTPIAPSLVIDSTRSIPPSLDQLVMEMLAKDANHRPASLSTVERRLRAILEAANRVVMARGTAADVTYPAPAKPARRWPWIAAALATVTLSIGGIVAITTRAEAVAAPVEPSAPVAAAPPASTPAKAEEPAPAPAPVVNEAPSAPPIVTTPAAPETPAPRETKMPVTVVKTVKPVAKRSATAGKPTRGTAKSRVLDKDGTIDVFAD